MSHSRIRPLAAASAIAVGLSAPLAAPAFAQSPGDAPPRLEKLEEGEAPAVTIRPGTEEQQITETRDHGRVTSIRVKTGGSTYYLKPNTPVGSALPGDQQSDAIRGAQWQILEFDLKRPQDQKQVEEQAANVPPPPEGGKQAAPAQKK